VVALFIFSVSFFLTISMNSLFGPEILLTGILIILNIYIYLIVFNPLYRYYSIYTILFFIKKKDISSKLWVVLLVLLVLVLFLYYPEVVQALNN